LGSEAASLAADWRAFGHVTHPAPVFLERGETRPLLLFGRADEAREGCTSVAVLGTPASNFVLRFLPLANGSEFPAEWLEPVRSEAGVAELVRCGEAQAIIGRLTLEPRSPRGVFEIVSGTGPEPMPSPRLLLPARDPGPTPPLPNLGPELAVRSASESMARFEQDAKQSGAVKVMSYPRAASADGGLTLPLELEAGCHEISVVADAPEARGSEERQPLELDVDAELYQLPAGTVLASDRAESRDAWLAPCTGSPSSALLRVEGAVPGAAVGVSVARYALPNGLPVEWGPDARAAMAEVLRAARARAPSDNPVFESLGVLGVTRVPIELEADACYRAAVTTLRGQTEALALGVRMGLREAQNNGGPGGRGTVVSFCAAGAKRATLEVESHGTGVAWLLGLWQEGRLAPGSRL
jgi:hypothetical protein